MQLAVPLAAAFDAGPGVAQRPLSPGGTFLIVTNPSMMC
jgi:hypothetical protein